MQNLNDFSPYQLTQIEQILISDLHLSSYEPVPTSALGQAFLALLDICLSLPNLQKLYILGDWFEAWLGDDIADTQGMQLWLAPILDKLQQLNQQPCQILVMRGNRDFLLGQKFCAKFGGKLIEEPYYFTHQHKKFRLEHGDRLCTDDKKYQNFRRIIQHPLTKKLLLAQSLKRREQIAKNLREKSQQDNQQKSMQIMDVNSDTVTKAMQHCDILIHGHTHRPQFHLLSNAKARVVLGDWRVVDSQMEAVIGIVHSQSEPAKTLPIELVNFNHKFMA